MLKKRVHDNTTSTLDVREHANQAPIEGKNTMGPNHFQSLDNNDKGQGDSPNHAEKHLENPGVHWGSNVYVIGQF